MRPFAMFVALVAALSCSPLAALAVPQLGKPAPAFDVPSSSGGRVTLHALRGKPLYINFFASWCGPCNAEAPAIGKLRAAYAKRGLQVIGIDELDAPGQGAAFVKKFGDPFGAIALDADGAVGKTYGAIAMPVHVFVDRRGIVTGYRLGELSPAEMETAIRRALR